MAITDTRDPTGDEFVSGTWTGTAGSRWSVVDDHPDTAHIDVLTHGTTAGRLTFTFTPFAVPTGSTSISVDVAYVDEKSSTSANNSGSCLKIGGAYYDSATHSPTRNSYVVRTDTYATNPATGAAWTAEDVNAIQAFGFHSTDANPTIVFASIQLSVTYTAPVANTTKYYIIFS
jgi:hypothetical protein